MKWTLIFIFGSSLAETILCWTYHYDNKTMNWTQARQWCQSHYTDMVVIQNQTENDYLVSILPRREGFPYFWIGITRNHKNETWTWIGNNSTWIGNNSWAENEPNNNYSTEFCVEIYTNSGTNRGKWNDEKCNSLKSPACYKTQCNATSCERGRCQETINSTRCLCERGFEGDRCQTAVECALLDQPDNGYYICSGGNQTFNTTCQFKCNPGFLMIGSPAVTCGDTRVWSGPTPFCSAVECPPLSKPDNGNNSCSGKNQTFNTTCQFKCDPGFFVIGSSAVTCGDTGFWSGPRPTCTSYKQALLAVAGCGALSTFCCICFCCIKHRQRKKLTQAA
ncbi:L-selectin [Archocentrus centrarchus]|uniref:L-selectin n=1 Tax=Archocentrus centrarchus TaxID=63155 RepID=UPI0011EA48AB|nr:L-selectin-like [Archocentrus centrarchus]